MRERDGILGNNEMDEVKGHEGVRIDDNDVRLRLGSLQEGSSSTNTHHQGTTLDVGSSLVSGEAPSCSSGVDASERDGLDHDIHFKRPKVHSLAMEWDKILNKPDQNVLPLSDGEESDHSGVDEQVSHLEMDNLENQMDLTDDLLHMTTSRK